MNKTTIIAIGTIIIIFFVVMFFNGPDKKREKIDDKVNWYEYDQGLEIAKANNMPIFLYFHADWCTYCLKMKITTFQDEKVAQYLQENFISIQVDTDNEKKTAGLYKVRGLPTIWFLEPDSTRITDVRGYVDKVMFYQVIHFIKSRAFENQTFEEYKESLKQ